jgi:hypothetical protein
MRQVNGMRRVRLLRRFLPRLLLVIHYWAEAAEQTAPGSVPSSAAVDARARALSCACDAASLCFDEAASVLATPPQQQQDGSAQQAAAEHERRGLLNDVQSLAWIASLIVDQDATTAANEARLHDELGLSDNLPSGTGYGETVARRQKALEEHDDGWRGDGDHPELPPAQALLQLAVAACGSTTADF